MCTREMTLGEEIINLTKRGIDVPTVERMYRKYIDLDEKGNQRVVMRLIWDRYFRHLILAIQFAIAELMLRRP